MTGAVARRYARALFELAKEQGTLEETGAGLRRVASVSADPGLAALWQNPLLPQAARHGAVATLADRLSLSPTMRNFLFLLADRGRLAALARAADDFERLLDREMGRVRALVRTARPLADDQRERVTSIFEKITARRVAVEVVEEPALLGGLVVEVEGKVYDGSVATQLERLATRIAARHG